jgi:hypothetical protein
VTFTSLLRTGYTDHADEDVSVWYGTEPGGVPVILVHGYEGSGLQWYTPAVSGTTAQIIGTAGVTAYGSDLGGGSLWGNDALNAAIDDQIAWGAATYGTSDQQVAFYMTSGGAPALNWVWRNPDKVVACALVIPAVDLQGIHDRDPAGIGIAASIEAAYGGAAGYLAALPTHDPSHPDNTAQLAEMSDRIRLWYSTTDNVIDPAEIAAFAAATGITAVSVGAQGHSLGPTANQDVLDWLIPRLWWA